MEVELINAKEVAELWPNIFTRISEEKIKEIRKGYSVKVNDGEEWIWITIDKIEKEKYIGKIGNKIKVKKGYDYGDELVCEAKNIFDIQCHQYKDLIYTMMLVSEDLNNEEVIYEHLGELKKRNVYSSEVINKVNYDIREILKQKAESSSSGNCKTN